MEKRKKKALLVLPLVAIPLLTLAFHALEGGSGLKEKENVTKKGINTELPDAKLRSDEKKDKFSLYKNSTDDTIGNFNAPTDTVFDRLGFNGAREIDRKSEEINGKLERLEKRLKDEEEADMQTTYRSRRAVVQPSQTDTDMRGDVDRLEKLMRQMQEDNGPDAETVQLNAMLQNILDIQHPERVANRTRSYLDTLSMDSLFRAIPATILDKKKAVQGATLKLRLDDTVTLSGQKIPKGHEIYGIVNIMNQRLLLNITNIRLGTSIIPVNLALYGLDGIEGLYAPDAILTETANLGADRAIGGIGMYGLDQSMATQLATAGIDAARSALGKRVRKVKVKIKTGQKVLLRDKSKKNLTK
ncbi:MAG: conjugative transposon protein TraM [Sphingobacterium sp.]|nr:conjugative transposon protein TraM [Sphingobacterium sp.]